MPETMSSRAAHAVSARVAFAVNFTNGSGGNGWPPSRFDTMTDASPDALRAIHASCLISIS